MESDPERDSSDVGRVAVDLLRFAAAGALAAVPVVGGSVGAVLTELALRRVETAVERMSCLIEEVAAERERGVEDLLEEIVERRDLRALLVASLETTSATEDERLLRMAGRILREGLSDDAQVDDCRVMLATIRQLEPAHLRVLLALLESTVQPEGRTAYAFLPLTSEQLVERWPEGANVLPAVLATLQASGLIAAHMFSPSQIQRPDHYKKDKSGWTNMPADNLDGFAPTSYGHRLAVYSLEP